jgi:putative Holliday junction resolvase
MGRILAIDYGTKRIGIAVTDPLQISVNGLPTQTQETYWSFLEQYIRKEEVEEVVLGYPEHADGTPTHLFQHIKGLQRKLVKNFSGVNVVLHPEDYTSKRASEIIMASGLKRKKRREKERIDKVSAILILQDYLGHLKM